ncbi:sialate O-acetylesterase [Adhaeribacter radiodurans]|uniref:9-O-acetylesterase n=1 Tax=Adhaeribacter radiodurans TaxID=2745197 RepID=A0A7L7L394_9BACT|nr:sialate O-acetylesterase [Adhaeribacter radiodurans]QMU27271.1 9-O-acetylesterase [Adhaeribacter radiodurans]
MKYLSWKFLLLTVFALATSIATIRADVRLPKLVSDNMVLQRDMKLPVWGWADTGEKVTVQFKGKSYSAQPNPEGKWQVSLPAMPAGGPYDMTISGKNTIVVKNILLGDVWLGSGQSNMEFQSSWLKYTDEQLGESDFPNIRLFTVENDLSPVPLADVKKAEWKICNKENAYNFSAVAFFFARELHQQEKVPVGVILTSWGGTIIETWMSPEAVTKFPELKSQIAGMNHSPDFLDKIKQENEAQVKDWLKKNDALDEGYKNGVASWKNPSVNATDWQEIQVPALWETSALPDFDGIVWLRKEFSLPADFKAQEVSLNLGPIDDLDQTWLNGTLVGESNQYNIARKYSIKPGILKPGKNVIVVRVTDTGGGGGIYGKPEELFLTEAKAGRIVDLSGSWQYRVGSNFKENKTGAPPSVDVGPNSRPTLLYNAMIKPLIPYAIKGMIWYQGESNAGKAYRYRDLFPAMIMDWRAKWGQGNFPFLFVQLANFMKTEPEPAESEWAELREAQTKTLAVPNTAMAVIIDIGEAEDIHPKNKQDVGKCLALAAEKLAYNKKVTYSGPLYKSMKVEGNRIRLTFDYAEPGLMTKNGATLKGFSIAGTDHKFVWADAQIEGNTVVVSSTQVLAPVAVRYAWANNPDQANLYNKANLPASPFRTDNWPGLTANKK